MKKTVLYFLSLGLLITPFCVKGQTTQPNFTLQTNESSDAKSYIARDYVSLKPGFQFTASTGKQFNAKIDQTLLFPPTNGTYLKSDGTTTSDPTQGAAVGSIPGQFAVSPSGAATYSIPIECPAGINGMQPNISLVYNSQGGNGIAGWGWNIGGLSMISRVPRTPYFDGEKTGIIWDNTSPLSLDGQRLIEVQRWSTDTTVDSIEYKTESEAYSRIVGYSLQNWGPLCFRVYTKNGQIIDYGNPANLASYNPLTSSLDLMFAVKNLSWNMVSAIDANGNYTSYTYASDTKDVSSGGIIPVNYTEHSNARIESITYGGNVKKQTQGNLSIKFTYKYADYPNIGYIDGQLISSNRILESINSEINSSVYRQYIPVYKVFDFKSHISSVKLINNKGEKLNPVTFDWSDNKYTYTNEGDREFEMTPLMSAWANEGFSIYSLINRTYGDIDGDGDQDILVRVILKQTLNYVHYRYLWVLYRNEGGRFSFLSEGNWQAPSTNSVTQSDTPFYFLDRNNDGKDELYIGVKEPITSSFTSDPDPYTGETTTSTSTIDCKYTLQAYSYLNGTLQRDYRIDLNFPNDIRYTSSKLLVLPGDFMGNGDPVFIVFYYDSDGTLHPINSSDINLSLGDIPGSNKNVNFYITDINGNGKSELMYVTRGGAYFYEVKKSSTDNSSFSFKLFSDQHSIIDINSRDKVFTGDFNGDGNTDFIVHKFQTPYNWELYYSTGNWMSGLTHIMNMNSTLRNVGNSDLLIIDINKDGKSDLLFREFDPSGNSKIKLLISNGGAFYVKLDEKYTGLAWFSGFESVGRFNLDKFDDIILQSPAWRYPIIGISNNVKFDKMIRINDSYSNETNLVYDLYNSIGLKSYDYQVDGDINVVNNNISAKTFGGWDIVKSVTNKYANNNETNVTSYNYGEAIIHKQGKGLLGYLSTSVYDETNSILKESQSKLNQIHNFLYPYSNVVKHITPVEDDNPIETKLSEEITEFDIRSNGLRYEMIPKQTTYSDFLTDLHKKVEFQQYDAFGNPEIVKTTQGDIYNSLASNVVETTTTSYIQRGAWCKNKVEDISTVKTSNNESYTRKKKFEYDVRGNLTKETIDPLDENSLVTEYSDFDDFGHPKTVAVKANNQTRYSYQRFTPSGRFLEWKKDNLGNQIAYNWNEATGLVDDETGLFGKTNYTYDGFGRLTETKQPNGIRSVNVLQWATSTDKQDIPGVNFCKYSEVSGSAPEYVWYDALGREIRKDTYGLDGRKICVSTTYENGKLKTVSLPYYKGATQTVGASYSYDEFGRIDKVTQPACGIMPERITDTDYSTRTTTVTSPEGTKSTTLNAVGQTESVSNNGKSVSYTYYPSGLTKTATPEGGISLSMEYDLKGNRIKLEDPDAGVVQSKYDGYGKLLWEKQQVHKTNEWITTTNVYDTTNGLLDRIERKKESTTNTTVETTGYTYDANNHYRLTNIEIVGKHKQSYIYGDFDRIKESIEEVSGKSFSHKTEFDALGRESKNIFPSGYYTVNHYNTLGDLEEVTDNANRSIWKAIEDNERGQLTKISKGGKQTVKTYDPSGVLTSIEASGIFETDYSFGANGNLNSRTDRLTKQKEQFLYDNHNRLTNWGVYKNNAQVKENNIVYDATSGNIQSKSDLGNLTMKYGEPNKLNQPGCPYVARPNPGPHALTSIQGLPLEFPTAELNVTYTDFKKIYTLTEGNKNYSLTYGVDDERRKSEFSVGGVLQKTRYYFGDYEEEIDATSGKVRKIHYLSGGALLVNDNGVETLYYGYYDYQGSLLALTDASGKIVEKYAYDPWGARRNPDDWTQKDTRTSWLNNIGYTGHEHIDAFGIINMNGRVYDPATSMFMSPDPYVQAPDNWLNYNRYGYCYGNPFKYTDPSGEFIHIIIGAAIGGIINLGIKAYQGKIHSFGDGLMAFGIGAVAGGVGAATGGAAFLAAGGGAVGAGGFAAGALGGMVGNVFASPIQSMGNSMYFGDPMMTSEQYLMGIAIGGLVGGSINGGIALGNGRTFWNGIPKECINPQPIPISAPQGVKVQEPEISPYNSSYQEPSEIRLPDKLYHYTSEDPSLWKGIGLDKTKTQYFTTDGELNPVNSRINLALDKTPRFRIEISTSDPNFNLDNIKLIRNVSGNVNSQGGGGIELLYKGIYQRNQYYQWNITTIGQ